VGPDSGHRYSQLRVNLRQVDSALADLATVVLNGRFREGYLAEIGPTAAGRHHQWVVRNWMQWVLALTL